MFLSIKEKFLNSVSDGPYVSYKIIPIAQQNIHNKNKTCCNIIYLTKFDLSVYRIIGTKYYVIYYCIYNGVPYHKPMGLILLSL